MNAVDLNRLSAYLRTKRGNRGLREVADEIGGVSASTLSRIEQGNIPDLETYLRICKWLGVSADEFSKAAAPSAEKPVTKDLAEVIEAQLRAERKLSRSAINAISQVVRFAYQASASGEDKSR